MTQLEILQSKRYDTRRLMTTLQAWRLKDQKIVFTNGCFDILHRGHIEYLAKAADLGNKLVIGLNSDASVRRLDKGASRPIQDEDSRATILAGLHFVDAIIIFDEETPYELIRAVKPDVLVKGGDWKPEEIVGHDIVKTNGGQVISIDFLEGYSTTNIENRIRGNGQG